MCKTAFYIYLFVLPLFIYKESINQKNTKEYVLYYIVLYSTMHNLFKYSYLLLFIVIIIKMVL